MGVNFLFCGLNDAASDAVAAASDAVAAVSDAVAAASDAVAAVSPKVLLLWMLLLRLLA